MENEEKTLSGNKDKDKEDKSMDEGDMGAGIFTAESEFWWTGRECITLSLIEELELASAKDSGNEATDTESRDI